MTANNRYERTYPLRLPTAISATHPTGETNDTPSDRPTSARWQRIRPRQTTEENADLITITELKPGAVLCKLPNPDSIIAKLPQIIRFTAEHGFPYSPSRI